MASKLKVLDKIQKALEEKHLHADVFEPRDNDELPYIECTKEPKAVKDLLKTMGIQIKDEYECNGSDYDSYIIVLKI